MSPDLVKIWTFLDEVQNQLEISYRNPHKYFKIH